MIDAPLKFSTAGHKETQAAYPCLAEVAFYQTI